MSESSAVSQRPKTPPRVSHCFRWEPDAGGFAVDTCADWACHWESGYLWPSAQSVGSSDHFDIPAGNVSLRMTLNPELLW